MYGLRNSFKRQLEAMLPLFSTSICYYRTKSSAHLKSNFAGASMDNFTLTDVEMTELMALSHPSGRRIALKEFVNCKDYPFEEECHVETEQCATYPSALAEKFRPSR